MQITFCLCVPCCCMLLATFLTSLATIHQGRLMSHGRNWQLHVWLSPIFFPYSKKTQPRYAKCVRQVAKGMQQHGNSRKPDIRGFGSILIRNHPVPAKTHPVFIPIFNTSNGLLVLFTSSPELFYVVNA